MSQSIQEQAEAYIQKNKIHFHDTHEEVSAHHAYIAGASSLQGEVERLREENERLKTALTDTRLVLYRLSTACKNEDSLTAPQRKYILQAAFILNKHNDLKDALR